MDEFIRRYYILYALGSVGCINEVNPDYDVIKEACKEIERLKGHTAVISKLKHQGKLWRERPVSPTEIREHVGLWTNASTMSKRTFGTQVLNIAMQ